MAEPARAGGGDEDPPEPPLAERCRNDAAFWLLGLCNNTPYVVMLSAAHDILRPPEMPPAPQNGSRYDCSPISTGRIFKHMAPLGFVYFAEYFINQGLLELLYFPESSLTHSEQYRWYQLLYQGAVFASRSSLRCCRFRPIWVLALLQGLTAGVLLGAVAAPFLPGLGAAFALVLLEGLLGGTAYGNAFLNVRAESPRAEREFAAAAGSVSDSAGIALAAAAALGAHRAFCPAP